MLFLILAWPSLALAQEPDQADDRREQPFPQAPGPSQPQVKATILSTSGQVLAIRPDTASVVLKCNPLKALGWKVESREFSVVDLKLLKTLKKGDRVKFDLRFDGKQFVIVDIDKF
ncbi:MAG: copper-binding protein [Deltaproteobacteria bacterium]|nr:copper-binding protein [Deltaproteobacteria bacterium]